MIETNSIMVSDQELDTPEAKLDLIALTGKTTYIKVVQQFAQQRLPKENPGGFTHEEIERMTEAEYEANREKILADMEMSDPKRPVYAEVKINENQLATLDQKMRFIKRFGYDRFMLAMGLHGLEELDDKAYHQVMNRDYKPYRTHVTIDG